MKWFPIVVAFVLMPKQRLIDHLARLGAQARITELHRELAEIYRRFPDLRPSPAATKRTRVTPKRRRRARRGFSAAQRRAASLRMKKYWEQRRKAKGAKSKT